MVPIAPNSSPKPVVGVDLGGTSVKLAVVSRDLEIEARHTAPTDVSDPHRLLDELERLVGVITRGVTPAAVGFGLPSQIDQRRGRVADSINVPIVDIRFVEEMERRLGVPVRIDNDANVACLAEARVGAGRGHSEVVMLTLGTGVGGGLVLGGELYRGSTGYAGELGHVVVAEDGPPCQGHCPNHGCLEIMASAAGLRAAAARVAVERPGGTLARAGAGGLEPHDIIEHGIAGDEDCVAALAVVGRHLGVGIAGFVNVFNPTVVIVGGGLMAAGELILAPAREEAGTRALRPPWREVEVVPAELGNDAGVIGAAALVL